MPPKTKRVKVNRRMKQQIRAAMRAEKNSVKKARSSKKKKQNTHIRFKDDGTVDTSNKTPRRRLTKKGKERVKRKLSGKALSWANALKQWNRGNDAWCIPRKGSKEYGEVKALMG